MNRQERFDYLYRRMSDHHFLNQTETGDELPFYICPYHPGEKFAIIEDTQLLKKKLAQQQITVLEFDLLEQTVQQCKTRGIWNLLKSGEVIVPSQSSRCRPDGLPVTEILPRTLASRLPRPVGKSSVDAVRPIWT